ncbi:MAG: hypothetical protein WC052_03995 [Patescibacteria group bacterium]|jgi:hypothetical protein
MFEKDEGRVGRKLVATNRTRPTHIRSALTRWIVKRIRRATSGKRLSPIRCAWHQWSRGLRVAEPALLLHILALRTETGGNVFAFRLFRRIATRSAVSRLPHPAVVHHTTANERETSFATLSVRHRYTEEWQQHLSPLVDAAIDAVDFEHVNMRISRRMLINTHLDALLAASAADEHTRRDATRLASTSLPSIVMCLAERDE